MILNTFFSIDFTKHHDTFLAGVLGCVTFFILLIQLDAPGVTWDEGLVNFEAAKNQAEWMRNLPALEAPFSKETIDRYWYTPSDHPSLPRTMAALSHLCFTGWVDEIVALRIPSALLFSILTATVYLFLRSFLETPAALFGALSLLCMPRVWGHAHLFSLDLPMMCWWFWTTIIAYRVVEGKRHPGWFGVVFGIAFTTKLHAAFLPFPLLLWGLLVWYQNRTARTQVAKRIAWAVVWAAILTPVIYIGLQPWLWHDTVARIVERFSDYQNKTPIALYYLGRIYRENTPWHYPFVMVSVTVPAAILVFFGIGIFTFLFKERGKISDEPFRQDQKKMAESFSVYGLHGLLVLMFLVPLVIVLFKQAYDGCRLFLACFPLGALMAGFGFSAVLEFIQKRTRAPWVAWSVLLVSLSTPVYALISYHPFYLAYYNEFVGGIRGAKNMGFETVYWCDALTQDFLDQINAVLPEDQTVHPKSMAHEVIDYYIERGWLKESFKDYPWDYALLQSRQSMFPPEEWTLYLRRRPVLKQELHGVQLYGLYKLE